MSDQNNQSTQPQPAVDQTKINEEKKRSQNKKILLGGIIILLLVLVVYVLCEGKNTDNLRIATETRAKLDNIVPATSSTSASSSSSSLSASTSPSSSSEASKVRRDLANLFRSYL